MLHIGLLDARLTATMIGTSVEDIRSPKTEARPIWADSGNRIRRSIDAEARELNRYILPRREINPTTAPRRMAKATMLRFSISNVMSNCLVEKPRIAIIVSSFRRLNIVVETTRAIPNDDISAAK